MPYRKAVFARGNYYHVYNRGCGRQPIFKETENYLFLLRQIRKYSADLDITIIAYCLMPNHYHFLVRQDGDQPAGIMFQRVFNSYTKAYNKRYGLSGTLFSGPFKAIHVDKEEYLIHLCRYIHGNPAKDGLVTLPEQWPYSNYLEWIGKRNGTLVDHKFVMEVAPDTEAYRQSVLAVVNKQAALPKEMDKYLG